MRLTIYPRLLEHSGDKASILNHPRAVVDLLAGSVRPEPTLVSLQKQIPVFILISCITAS